MSALKDLEQILRAYTQKKSTSTISQDNLERYAAHWAGEFRKTRPDFTDFSTYTPNKYHDLLEEAEKENMCSLKRDEFGIQQISYLRYFPYMLRNVYEEAEQRPESSFPSEDILGETIPDAAIHVVEIKEQFVPLLDDLKQNRSTIYRFLFPEGVRSMIIIGEIIQEKLLPMCIMKLRTYLSLQKNSEYAVNKMYGIFPKKEQLVKDLLSNIMTQRDVALRTLTDPDDFTFQFWTYLSSFVLSEYREKANKLDREHGFSQACHLLGLYSLFYKGRKKRQREKEQTFRHIDQNMRKPPYLFTFTDLYGMRDKVGLPISKKISQQELAGYLERRTKRKKDGPVTDILRIITSNKDEFYVHKERLLNLALQRVQIFSREVRAQYVKEWTDALGDFKKLPVMNSRELFQNDLWARIKEQDPLLSRVLRYDLMYICLKETKPSREIYIEANRIINQKQQNLIPIDEIMRIDQKRIQRDARTYLPLWKSIPVVGVLGVFFGRIFRKLMRGAAAIKDPSDIYASMKQTSERGERRGAEEYASSANGMQSPQTEETYAAPRAGVKRLGTSSSMSSRSRTVHQQVEFKKAIYELKNLYIGQDGDIQESLEELIEEWNPLVDGKAKQNLVEDVNSAVRDFLRKLKRSLMVKPPDEARVKNLSKQIADYEAFKRIKRKDAFRRYIELYMIKLLSLK